MAVTIHTAEDIAHMRVACRLASEVLDYITPFVTPGVTTGKLNELCHAYMRDVQGTVPAPLNYAPPGYPPFPASICSSVNDVICHGIPGDKVLKDGDILNIDVTPLVDGWHGDTSRMFFAGEPPLKARKLVEVTYECLMLGIEQARPGNHMGDVAHAIQQHAEKHRYGVVRDFCGHGLGLLFHDAPEVVHAAKAGTGPELKPGMFFTIEPMINLGKPWAKVLGDGWTAVTRDKSLSAQFEHSIAITETGNEIFTKSPTGRDCPPYV
jgi:methionyl aminopeptidase